MMNRLDFERYRRQTAFQPLGLEGQERLARSRVLTVGCGALGGSLADLLVRAGVGVGDGAIALVDPDVVQLDNLHRQTLFTEEDARRSRRKVEAARERLLSVNSAARLEIFPFRFEAGRESMVETFDLLIDATDNFETRFLLNRTAVRYGKTLITAGISGASGQIMTVRPGTSACLECFLDPKDESNDGEPFSVLPPLPSLFASLQALEAIKLLADRPEALRGGILAWDLWENRLRQLSVVRDRNCPVCGRLGIVSVSTATC